MKRLMNALKLLRRPQWLALAAALSVLIFLSLNNPVDKNQVYTEEELRISHLISSIEGIKSANVVIAYDAMDHRVGAVVVARGRNDIPALLEIQRSVQTLTGLNLDSIEIVLSES